MQIKDLGINVYAGPGRKFFEFYLTQRSPLRKHTGEKEYCKRLTQESTPEDAIEFALTEDLFLPKKVLVFPDYENLRQELKGVVVDLNQRRGDLKATVIVPVKYKSKMGKLHRKVGDIVEVSEDAAIKAATDYVKGILKEQGIAVSPDVVELLTVSSVDDPHSLISEVEKITVAFSNKKVVTMEDLTKLSVVRTELEIFRILKEITRGSASKGISDFYRYISMVEESELLRILGALQWSLKNEYGRTKATKTKRKLLKLLFLAGDIDLKIKGGSRLPPREIFQNALVSMADIVGR